MRKRSKIEKLISKFLLLHDRKIDLSLDRINRLNKDLKTDLNKLKSKTITVSGTNGKWSTATTVRSIFEAAGYKVDFFTSPPASPIVIFFTIPCCVLLLHHQPCSL